MFKALFQIHVNLRNIIVTHDDNRNQDQNIVFRYKSVTLTISVYRIQRFELI